MVSGTSAWRPPAPLMAARSRLPSKPCTRIYIGHTCYAADGADICADISSEESAMPTHPGVGDDLPECVTRLVTGGESY
jgi:hypothetical protein